MIIRYADAEAGMECSVIARYTRENAPPMVMSASSGPKDYIKNDVAAVFESRPEVEELAFVRGSGKWQMFALFRIGPGWWVDASGRRVMFD